MKQKAILDILDKKYRKLNRISAKLLLDFNAENIHKFRVQCKQLFSFFRLLKFSAKRRGRLRKPRKLKKIYKELGTIRVLQMQEEKITKIVKEENEAAPVRYLNALRLQKGSSLIKSKELLKRKLIFRKGKKGILKRIPEKVSASSIRNFIRDELDTLRRLLSSQMTDDTLHRDRKLLKDILFTLSYVKQIHSVLPASLTNENCIKKITDSLGDFHDICTRLSLLDPDSQSEIQDEKELIVLKKIKQQWENDRSALRSQLISEFTRLDLIHSTPTPGNGSYN